MPTKILPPDITPPNSDDAEKGCLGSALKDWKRVAELVQLIQPEYFYSPPHQVIYRELVELWERSEKFDFITFTQHLRDKNLLESVGGHSYVTDLFSFVPTASNIAYYAGIVKDKWILRQVIESCTHVTRSAYFEQAEASEVLATVMDKLSEISDPKSNETKTIKELTSGAIDAIEKAYSGGGIPGLSTGLQDLDRKLGGLKPGQLVVIAGNSGSGKTALAMNIVEHNTLFAKIPCGIVSLEMSGEELVERMIASVAKIDLHALVTKRGVESDFPKMTTATARIVDAPIFIRDDSDVDPVQLRGIGRHLKRQNNIQILVIDYIQLLSHIGKEENRERSMSSAAQAAKQMARELDIVVILLSQLNDDGMLRESRAIGHHADAVLKIKHPDEDSNDPCTIFVAKNRKGPVGPVSITFLKYCARFCDYSKIPQ